MPATRHTGPAVPQDPKSVLLSPDSTGRVALDQLPLDRWLRSGIATRVKSGTHRSVYRLDLPEGEFFLKHDRYRRLLSRLRTLFRRSASSREWHKSRELRRRRIATVEATSYGEITRRGLVAESFVLLKAIPNAVSLDWCLGQRLPSMPRRVQARTRRLLARRLAELLAAAHRAGVRHNDLHAGNILVVPPPEGAPCDKAESCWSLYLIDLPGVRLSKPLSWGRSRDNLVMLAASFQQFASRSDALRFWKAYAARRSDLALPDVRQAAWNIERRVRRYQRRLQASRDKRCLATNRDFRSIVRPGVRAHVASDLGEREVELLLSRPDSLLSENWHQAVKLTRGSVLVRGNIVLDGRGVPLAYRRYQPKSLLKRVAWLFVGSRGRRLWRHGNALVSRQIATPRPLALVELNGGFRRPTCYLATTWLEGALNLHQLAWRWSELPSRERSQRVAQCAESLGKLVGRLHRWNYAHRDLKACNLVAIPGATKVATYLVDLDGLRRRAWLSRREAARNLGRLAASFQAYSWIRRTDYLRFLRAYLKEAGRGTGEWKRHWQATLAGCRRVIRQRRRRGRPIL